MIRDHTLDETDLAGEYVLGTLGDAEQAAFEQRLAQDETLQQAVEQWQRRLAPMLLAGEPIAPPAAAWHNIESRINPKRKLQLWDNLFFWRTLGLSTAALALLLTIGLFVNVPDAPLPGPVMVVMNDHAEAGWVIGNSRQSGTLKVTAIDPTPMPKGKVCQVWLKSPQGKLASLGTLPDDGWKQLSLPDGIQNASQILISVEDQNQLPTAPTGQIIFSAPLTRF